MPSRMMNRRTIFTPQRYVPGKNTANVWAKYISEEKDPSGLIVKKIDDVIGYGVFAEKKIPAGSFIMEYHGELVSEEEGIRRERSYPADYGSFLLYFKSGRKIMCVDATFSIQCGRFVNDGTGEVRNAELRVVYQGTTPHVALFSTRNIPKNEEIRFDYGVKGLPWRENYRSLYIRKDKSLCHSVKECIVLLHKLDPEAETCLYEKEDGTNTDIKICKTHKELVYQPSPSYDFVARKISLSEECNSTFVFHENLYDTTFETSPSHGYCGSEHDITDGDTRNSLSNDKEKGTEYNRQLTETTKSTDETDGQLSELNNMVQNDMLSWQITKCQREMNEANESFVTASETCNISTSEVVNDIHTERDSFVILSKEQTFCRQHTVNEENLSSERIGSEERTVEDSVIPSEDDLVVHYIVIEDASASSSTQEPIQMPVTDEEIDKLEESSVSPRDRCLDAPVELSESPEELPDVRPKIRDVDKKSKSTSRLKPHRPCPYCLCFKSALSKHLVKKHGDEAEVKQALELPSQDRNRAFQLLKRRGIMTLNMKTLGSEPNETNKLIRERKRTSPKEDTPIYCSKCFGFFSRHYFHRHRRTCHLNERSVYLPHAVQPERIMLEEKDEDRYATEILGPMYNDEVGSLCKRDTIIVSYGKKQFRKLLTKNELDKFEDKKTTIRSEMRRLGHLYREFKEICAKNSITCESSLEMYTPENFYIFQEAIENITTKDDGSIKSGPRKDLGYLVKRVCKFLHGKFSVERQKEKISILDDFLNILTFYWTDIFGEAEFSLMFKRQTHLRKPLKLPKQSDVQRLRDYTLMQIRKLTESKYNFITSSDFNKLRNLVLSRLTLFNARRGGEPCCLQISQWQEAENDIWLGDSGPVQDPVEQDLLGKFKIAYQSGKGGKLVPLLILDDCWAAIRKLCDSEIRGQAGVHPNNNFVFPHTHYSFKHVSGWTAVNDCCSWAGLDKTINATGMRHYVATLYASLEVKESERQTFYSHMGHSEAINKNVYQSPLARQTILQVGKFLHEIDQGKEIPSSSQTTIEENSQSSNASEISDARETLERGINKEQVVESSKTPQSSRQYKLWARDDTDIIKNHFKKYILSTEHLDTNKGKLPGVEELEEFIEQFPNILPDLPRKERVKRIHSKIFNERKLTREKLRKIAKTSNQ